MSLFKIKDQDDSVAVETTHYYKWLKGKKVDNIHAIKTKTEYLIEQGFNVGVDRVTEEDLKRLKAIETLYFNAELKNKERWEQIFKEMDDLNLG